jgi:cation transport ATPase
MTQNPATPNTAGCTLQVEGMDCSSCAGTIESALRGVEGVRGMRTDVMGRRVAVRYDAGGVTPAQVERIVAGLGMQPRLLGDRVSRAPGGNGAARVEKEGRRAALVATSRGGADSPLVIPGMIVIADALRPNTATAPWDLRRAGIEHIALLTGTTPERRPACWWC